MTTIHLDYDKMLRLEKPFGFFCICLSFVTNAFAEDPELEAGRKRIRAFFQEAGTYANEDYSVVGRFITVEKPMVKPENGKEWDPTKLSLDQLTYSESLFRKIMAVEEGQPTIRFENRKENPTIQGRVKLFDQALFSTDFCFCASDTRQGQSIREYDVRLKKPIPEMAFMNPIFAPLTSHFGLGQNFQALKGLILGSRVLESGALSDGKYQVVIVTRNGNKALRLVFAEKPSWLLLETHVYRSSEAVNFLECELEDIKDWQEYMRNKAVWKRIGERWVVSKVFTWQWSMRNLVAEGELTLTGWKFGEDVEQGLLDKKAFTTQGILASTDYEQILDEVLSVGR